MRYHDQTESEIDALLSTLSTEYREESRITSYELRREGGRGSDQLKKEGQIIKDRRLFLLSLHTLIHLNTY